MITDEMLDRYVALAYEYHEAGMSESKAKAAAREAMGIEFDSTDFELLNRTNGAWRRNPKRFTDKRENGSNGHVPQNGFGAVDMTRWLFKWVGEHRGGFKVGDLYEIWPEQLVAMTEVLTGWQYTYQAFINEFTQEPYSKLQADGYRFTCITKRGERPIVFRIDGIPQPPAPVLIEETKGPVQPPEPGKVFTRAEAESMAAYAASKALEEFMKNLQMANGRLPL